MSFDVKCGGMKQKQWQLLHLRKSFYKNIII